MAFGKKTIGVRVGAATKTSVKILVVDLVPYNLSLYVDGQLFASQVPTKVNTGTDTGFSTVFNVTGLSPDSIYSFIVEQSITGNQTSGTFRTLPGQGADFSLFFITCNKNELNPVQSTGMYGYMRDYAERGELPVAGILHIDDVVYSDTLEIDDTADSGLVSTGEAATTYSEFDRALPYLADFGLLGTEDRSTTNERFSQGYSADRQWCYSNLNTYFQWGDHEIRENAGWNDTAKTNPAWSSSIAVWDNFFGGIMPSLLAATSDHSEAQHWGIEFGDLYFTCVDRITMGTGGQESGTVQYGNTQIDEVLSGINTACVTNGLPFCLLGLSNSIRSFFTSASTDIQYLANEPIADYRATEYGRLMTDTVAISGQDGLQKRANDNGFVFATLHGDHHNPLAIHHRNTGGNENENYLQIGAGTVNGSQNHTVDATAEVGQTRRESTLLYKEEGRGNSTYNSSCIRIDVLGSKSPKKFRVAIVDQTHKDVWSREWVEGGVNSGGEVSSGAANARTGIRRPIQN